MSVRGDLRTWHRESGCPLYPQKRTPSASSPTQRVRFVPKADFQSAGCASGNFQVPSRISARAIEAHHVVPILHNRQAMTQARQLPSANWFVSRHPSAILLLSQSFGSRRGQMATQDPPSLYERLGGVYSIATEIDDYIDRIIVDPRLNANPRVDEAHHRVLPAGFK